MPPLIRQKLPAVLALALIVGCSTNEFKPEELPVRFETVLEYPGNAYTSDLNCDGKDEFIFVSQSPSVSKASVSRSYLGINTLDNQIIERVNYAGRVIPWSLHFLDYDDDGQLEILVPYIVNDSLFVSIVSSSGKKLFGFFLIAGHPRKEDSGEIAWDPFIPYFCFTDIDGDSSKELVTVVNTALARLPRGVLIHTVPDGKPLGRLIVGASLYSGFFDDFDGDQRLDFVTSTVAVNNGASVGGFDDQHAYIINFNLRVMPRITRWRALGNLWNWASLAYHDFDLDGKKELLCFTTGTGPTQKAQLELIKAENWETIRRRTFNELLRRIVVIDLDRDLNPEIVITSASNELLVLDHQFEIKKRRAMVPTINFLAAVSDLDGDGIDDLFVANMVQSFLLTSELDIKGVFPRFESVRTVQTGIGVRPYLLVTQVDRSNGQIRSLLLRQQENRFYLWHRYGPTTLKTLGAGLVLALALMTAVAHRRNQRQRVIHTFITDTDRRALLLLDGKGKIVSVNVQWRQMISMNREERQSVLYTKAVAWPELVAFIRRALIPPERRHETTLAFTSHGRQIRALVVVEPITMAKENGAYWLVSVSDRSVEMDAHQAQTWSLMAERVAHDLKSPLTSILLTLQRLQKEYRNHSPQHAHTYDEYAKNIMERIEALRRLTRNFLKLIDIEQLHLVETEVNRFLQQAVGAINFPPDIQCELKLSAEPCLVPMDHEQMHVVLENLVTNAINAMPEGGKITLAASLARDLHLPNANGNARDYAVLEVQDTGIGIPASAHEHIFEPRFTTSENGTGLGLAMVKKIVAAHHGHIEFESEEGTGTVFSVYLPVK